ncbi:MAG: hydrogenase maturation protease [Sulfuricella sp.]|nr:hydrogenase maturation protease [Sulfuricella sp.]
MTAALLVFGYGNPSRGDDAIAPVLLQRLNALELPNVEFVTDFQLQVEHALDLVDRELVLFIDASVVAPPPYTFTRLTPQQDASYTSHEMSPAAVLHVYQEIHRTPPPPCFLLGVRGEFFDLGAPLSEDAEKNAEAAFALLRELCANPRREEWENRLS